LSILENEIKIKELFKNNYLCPEEFELFNNYLSEIEILGNTILVPLSRSLEIMNKSNKYPLAIIGIDVFFKKGKYFQPSEVIADYSNPIGDSWEEFKNKRFDLSMQFIKSIGNNATIFLEFVFFSKNQWLKEHR
jgi:hypothetical protein